MKLAKLVFFTFSTVICNAAFANIQPLIHDPVMGNLPISSENKPDSESRFRQHEVNQLLLDYTGGGGLDGHVDVQLSVGYLLTEPNMPQNHKEGAGADWNLALAGTIEFDFFVGTRDSSPVVGRRYNPSLQYYYSQNQPSGWLEWRFSVEHESNGQATDNSETLNELTRSFAHQYSDKDDVDLQDAFELATETISLSNNFVSAGGVYRVALDNADMCHQEIRCFDVHVKIRQQIFGDGQNGEFRSIENANDRIKDYQGTKVALISRWSEKSSIGLTLRTGQLAGGDPFKRNTLELAYYYVLDAGELKVPFVFSYRNGYLEEFYNYSNRSSTFQFGFNFLY